jgi:signal transduction histidine kinase
VLLVGAVLLLAAVAWFALWQAERDADQVRLDAAAASLAATLRTDLDQLAAAAGDAAVAVSLLPELTEDTYADLLSVLAIEQRFPGVVGVSYVERVPRPELEDHLALRRRSDPGYTVVDDAGEDLLRLVAFSHPSTDNAAAIGVDLTARAETRAAADVAIDLGQPVLSNATRIVQFDQQEPGAVLHAPVPSTPGRRDASVALVFSTQGVAERLEPLPSGVAVLVTDTRSTVFPEVAVLGDAGPDPLLSDPIAVTVADATWQVQLAAAPAFTAPWTRRGSTAVALGGSVAALLVALLAFSLATRERLASQLVAERTAELSAVNDRLALSNAALADANRAKDEFLASVSHELRTPLTVIGGFSDSLRRVRPEDRDLERFLDPIDRNVHRLDTLVSDLLTLVSLDAGAVTPFREHVDLASVLPDASEVLAGLESSVQVDVGQGCIVSVDPRHLDRVVTNLLVNADRHGAPPFELSARQVGATVELAVRDHGAGIPPEEREALFERFARGDSSHSVAGTGLGLAIVRELVELNGGDVRYEDAAPGARFVVRLARPAAPLPRRSVARDRAGAGPGGRGVGAPEDGSVVR